MTTAKLSALSSKPLVRIIILGMAVASMLAFGVFGIGRDGGFGQGPYDMGFDMKILYIGGLTWLQGLNAYDPQIASQVSGGLVSAQRYDFAYPPQIAPFVLLLGLFPFAKARALMILLNLFSILAVAFFCVRFVQRGSIKELDDTSSAPKWFIPAIIIGNPFTAHILWMGQTSMIATAAWVGGWYFAERKRWLLSGILIGFSTFKPQVTLLILIWLLLERRLRLLGVAALSILIFSLYPMLITGPIAVFKYWLGSLKIYTSLVHNSLGFQNIFGLQNALHSLGINLPNLLPVGVILVGILWWQRRQFLHDDIIGILPAIALLMGFSHDYDLVVLAPLVAVFWRHLHHNEEQSLVGIIVMASMFFPQRFLRPLKIDFLLHYRVFILVGALIWLLVLSYRKSIELRTEVSLST